MAKKKKKSKNSQQQPTIAEVNNFVAKHAREFNKAHVHIDRKKEAKKGSSRKAKHKKGPNSDLFCS